MTELILNGGDYEYDGAGGFKHAGGAGDELLRRCLVKLQARRGGMPLMPSFGSRLHTLGSYRVFERDGAAARFCAEALDGEPVTVQSASVRELDGVFALEVKLEYSANDADTFATLNFTV